MSNDWDVSVYYSSARCREFIRYSWFCNPIATSREYRKGHQVALLTGRVWGTVSGAPDCSFLFWFLFWHGATGASRRQVLLSGDASSARRDSAAVLRQIFSLISPWRSVLCGNERCSPQLR